MSGQQGEVTRRRVFHIPGFDPMHPRRYRELYRKECVAQAKISGYEIAVQSQTAQDAFRWTVAARTEGQPVLAEVEVLVWSDIVRDSMAQSIPGTYLQLIKTSWIYLTTGTFRRLMWLRKGPVFAALYPGFMRLGQLLLAMIVGSLFGRLVEGGILAVPTLFGLSEGLIYSILAWTGWALGWSVWAILIFVILRWFKAKDGKLFAYYLMHDYAFSARLSGENPSELEDRLTDFSERIAQAMQADVEEVLIVGHSSGAHLAVSVVADLLRDGKVTAGSPKLALLTLGQVIPMVSFLPRARRLRSDLAYLAASDMLTWVDVSAPGDGCCFALCDPVAVTGVTPPGKRWPLVISAAFSQTLSPEKWRALRWRFFRLHFQYLCAFDRPADFDYFQITAGPKTLAARYAGRKPSGSRIDIAVSKYTSLKP